MASIDVPCVNPECDSEDIEILSSAETRNGVFEHIFKCSTCDTKFCISTELIFTKIPQEAQS